MPSLLLDHNVSKAAAMRRDEPPRHRFSRRQRRHGAPVSVAQVVTAADLWGTQAQRRAPAGQLGLGGDDHRVLTFDDIRSQGEPEWALPDAAVVRERAYRAAEAAYSELAPGAAVEADLRAAVAKERAVYALADYVLTDTEVALARLAMAVSDLAVQPGRSHALSMALAPIAAQLAEVTL